MNWKHKNNKKRLTTIAAISINGLLVTKTVKGSVNKEVYQQFLEENLELFRNKLLIQDNARCHHARTVKVFASENDLELKYNPAYSPQFNPIELAFNKVKRHYRKFQHINMQNDINEAFSTITPEDCQGFYRKTNRFINQYL
jgi:transposase